MNIIKKTINLNCNPFINSFQYNHQYNHIKERNWMEGIFDEQKVFFRITKYDLSVNQPGPFAENDYYRKESLDLEILLCPALEMVNKLLRL